MTKMEKLARGKHYLTWKIRTLQTKKFYDIGPWSISSCRSISRWYSLPCISSVSSGSSSNVSSLTLSMNMDKLHLTGQNLGRVFNSRIGHVYAKHSCCYWARLPALKLKTRPKQLLGSLPLDLELSYMNLSILSVSICGHHCYFCNKSTHYVQYAYLTQFNVCSQCVRVVPAVSVCVWIHSVCSQCVLWLQGCLYMGV